MSKRYYLCDIIGDGDADAPTPWTPTTGPFRPAVAEYNVNWSGLAPTGEDGRPTFMWALVIVGTGNHTVLRDDPHVDAMPDVPLDAKVSSISAESRTALADAMIERGIVIPQFGLNAGYREIVRAIGQVLQPDFDENRFDVNDAT